MLRRGLLLCMLPLMGCLASTIRVSLAPTLDSGGRPGFEAMLGAGIGIPADLSGRSHHYLQTLASLGGGLDGQTRKGMFTTAADLDYIYWASPRVDLRGGVGFAYRTVPSAGRDLQLFGLGGHVGVLPVLAEERYGWLVRQLCLGPQLQVQYLWSDPAGSRRTLVSLPLLAELNFLVTGD